jgi:hypothetical protein
VQQTACGCAASRSSLDAADWGWQGCCCMQRAGHHSPSSDGVISLSTGSSLEELPSTGSDDVMPDSCSFSLQDLACSQPVPVQAAEQPEGLQTCRLQLAPLVFKQVDLRCAEEVGGRVVTTVGTATASRRPPQWPAGSGTAAQQSPGGEQRPLTTHSPQPTAHSMVPRCRCRCTPRCRARGWMWCFMWPLTVCVWGEGQGAHIHGHSTADKSAAGASMAALPAKTSQL